MWLTIGVMLIYSLGGPDAVEVHSRQSRLPKANAVVKSVVYTAPRGTPDRVLGQNAVADEHGVEKVKDDAKRDQFLADGRLVRVPDVGLGYHIDTKEVKFEDRIAHPKILEFLYDFGPVYFRGYGEKYKREFALTSFTRTEERHQSEFVEKSARGGSRYTSSADCREPRRCSLHVRGIAFDISIKGMDTKELSWMLRELGRVHYARAGVDVTFEPNTAHFHVIVYPFYSGYPEQKEEDIVEVAAEKPARSKVRPKQPRKIKTKKYNEKRPVRHRSSFFRIPHSLNLKTKINPSRWAGIFLL